MSVDSSTVSNSDVAVVGMAGRFAGARNLREFWHNLRGGVESMTTYTDEQLLAAGADPAVLPDPNYVRAGFPLPDMEMFDAPFFGFAPREAAIMDPQHRHFLECAWEALEDAGHVPDRFPGAIGVFGGSGHSVYMPYNLLTNPALCASVGFFLLRHTGNDKDFLTTRLSYLLDLKGPSINVQTACSTSLVAIHLGCQSLLNGECDMALAGGVTIELPHRQGYVFQEGEILSADGHCRAFDARSQGTVFGSGVGVVVLRRLADAVADGDHIHAVIKGSAINNDGAGKVGYLAPSVDGQAECIAEALAVGNVDPETVTYVETHGTGTQVGDPIEVLALTQAFRQGTDKTGFCGIGSVKSNIGHTDTAAGVASFIKATLALEHRMMPPSLHFTAPNPDCHFERTPFYVNAELKDWQTSGTPRRAGVSSLGVGGTNAHVVLEEAPEPAPSAPSRPRQLLVLSAKTPAALDAATSNLADALEGDPGLALADVAYTLQVGRQAMKHRRVLVCADASDAVASLRSRDPQRLATQAAADGRSAAFLFAGGGAQYPNMGADLFRTEPVYCEAVDRGLELLRPHAGYDLRPYLYPAAGKETEAAAQLERPAIALPALFITQYALARLWMSWGIAPKAMIGHSMGEYTAAHLAGVFGLEDALALVALRGRLFETVPEGGMLSVSLPVEELKTLLGGELSVAAVNGPSLCVASGPVRAIEALEQILTERDVDSVRIRIAIAAHSAMLEPILAEFGAFFRGVALHAPTLPFASNLSGTWITAAEATDPAYWVRQLRETVRFADGLRELLKDSSRILLEVGPGRTLSSLARQHPDRAAAQAVLSSLRHPDEEGSDVEFLLNVAGRLWMLGHDVDWAGFHAQESRRRVPLPTYPFEHQRHWIEPGKQTPSAQAKPAAGDLHKRADVGEWFYQPSWKRSVPPVSAVPAEPGLPALVFCDEVGIGERLASRLEAAGRLVVRVTAGDGFARRGDHAFAVHPGSPEDYGKLLQALGKEGRLPRDIVHLWTVTNDAAGGDRTAERMLDLGFYSLLHLAQAIGNEDLSDPLKLIVVSSGVQQVAGEPALAPIKATVLGPVKVIGREFPNVSCTSVDVVVPPAGSWQETLIAEQLQAELDVPAIDEAVAYRGHDRWVETFEQAPLPAPPAPRSQGDRPQIGTPGRRGIRPQGVYLITGGLGGVALVLAEHLARTARARLVLLGRSGLPPREEWEGWRSTHGAEDRTSRRIAKVQGIEALGAEVMVAAADVTNREQVRRVVEEVRRRFGAIHGVVHTAGVLNDGVIQLKTREVAASVLAPKVAGTLVLDEALAGETLDFFMLFSSLSSISGLAGQVDYAAANAFLDAFARYRTSRDGTPTVAVNWSAWQEVGMAAELARQLGIGTEITAGAPEGVAVGHPFVDRCLRDTPEERLYSTRFSVRNHWLLDEHRVRGGEALIPGAGYLEIVRAAFEQHPEPRAVEVRDVAFVSPFVVRAEEERELRVRIRPNGQLGQAFSILSRGTAGPAESGGWQEHVRGLVGYADLAPATPTEVAAIQARCRVSARVFIEPEQPQHLVFGPRWGNVKRIDYGTGEALVTLELPEVFASDLEHHKLHPAVLDMATAGAQALIPGFDEREDFFVPLSYGALRMRRALPRKGYSHIRYRSEESSGKEFAVFDVTILDEGGTEVVDVVEFAMMRLQDKAQLVAAPPERAPALVDNPPPHARPHATANTILSVGLKEGILPAEGMEAFDRIVSAGVLPQVVASSQDLHALLAQLRAPEAPRAQEPREDAAPGRDLGPVEAALAAHEAVREAAAAEVRDASGARRVVAYMVYDQSQHVTVSELRRYLRDAVPEDLVPQSFIDLDNLPRTADGAIDRRALPNPFGPAEDAVAPSTPMEVLIGDLWRELLGLETVSVYDNFFDVGGHSLLSMRLISRLDKKSGVRLQHADIVVNTLQQLASKCEQLATGTPAAPPPPSDAKRGFLSAVKTVLGR